MLCGIRNFLLHQSFASISSIICRKRFSMSPVISRPSQLSPIFQDFLLLQFYLRFRLKLFKFFPIVLMSLYMLLRPLDWGCSELMSNSSNKVETRPVGVGVFQPKLASSAPFLLHPKTHSPAVISLCCRSLLPKENL